MMMGPLTESRRTVRDGEIVPAGMYRSYGAGPPVSRIDRMQL